MTRRSSAIGGGVPVPGSLGGLNGVSCGSSAGSSGSGSGSGVTSGGGAGADLGSTTPVGAERLLAVSVLLVTMRRTRRTKPTSAVTGTYVSAVAPLITVHDLPSIARHRCHFQASVGGVELVHVACAVSVCPSWSTPLIVGPPVIFGSW